MPENSPRGDLARLMVCAGRVVWSCGLASGTSGLLKGGALFLGAEPTEPITANRLSLSPLSPFSEGSKRHNLSTSRSALLKPRPQRGPPHASSLPHAHCYRAPMSALSNRLRPLFNDGANTRAPPLQNSLNARQGAAQKKRRCSVSGLPPLPIIKRQASPTPALSAPLPPKNIT